MGRIAFLSVALLARAASAQPAIACHSDEAFPGIMTCPDGLVCDATSLECVATTATARATIAAAREASDTKPGEVMRNAGITLTIIGAILAGVAAYLVEETPSCSGFHSFG